MLTGYKMQTVDCRLGFMQTRYKLQTVDCRLGLKCRLRLKLSHRLIRDIFSSDLRVTQSLPRKFTASNASCSNP